MPRSKRSSTQWSDGQAGPGERAAPDDLGSRDADCRRRSPEASGRLLAGGAGITPEPKQQGPAAEEPPVSPDPVGALPERLGRPFRVNRQALAPAQAETAMRPPAGPQHVHVREDRAPSGVESARHRLTADGAVPLELPRRLTWLQQIQE